MFDQTLSIRRERPRESNLACQYLSVYLHGICSIKWVNAVYHFVDEDAQCPPVDWFAVSFVHDDFRCDVLRCAAQGVCFGRAVLGEPEICEFQVTV